MTATAWMAAGAALALVLGLLLVLLGRGMRHRCGLGEGADGSARPGNAYLAAVGADRQAGSADTRGGSDYRRGMEIVAAGVAIS